MTREDEDIGPCDTSPYPDVWLQNEAHKAHERAERLEGLGDLEGARKERERASRLWDESYGYS